jgi:deoxyribonuclease-4
MPLDCEEGWREVVEEIAGTVSLERMGLIHANDCLYERGSRRDRHAWIGEGFIGAQGFTAMMCCNELDHVPVVCEMPGEVPLKDEVNLGRLKELRAACAPSH